MTSSTLKWALGAVIVPVGLSLAVSGLSVASFQGQQQATNTAFEKEMLMLRSDLKDQVSSIQTSISNLEGMQKTIAEKQIELVVKARIKDEEASKFYSDFQEVRDKVLILNASKGGAVGAR